MSDELAKAITRVIHPALKQDGFRRHRRRDLVRVINGVAHGLYFQVSGWGDREFCVTAFANLVAGHDVPALTPGFRLSRDTDGGDLWLPSLTAEQAELSAQIVLGSIRAEALPFFDSVTTPQAFAKELARHPRPDHHNRLQQGIAEALAGNGAAARKHLADAVELYEADGHDWCADYADKARQLGAALAAGTAEPLLHEWYLANQKAHGVGA
jgi:hypothetical protein